MTNKTAQITWDAAQRLIESGILTRDTLFDRVADGSMGADVARQCSERLSELEKIETGGLVYKKTKSGYLFVKNEDWPKAWSKKKDTEYNYSMNIPWHIAKAFFADTDGIAKLTEFVNATK